MRAFFPNHIHLFYFVSVFVFVFTRHLAAFPLYLATLTRHSLSRSLSLTVSLPNRQFICCRRRRRCSAAAAFAALGFVAFQLASLSTVEVGKET